MNGPLRAKKKRQMRTYRHKKGKKDGKPNTLLQYLPVPTLWHGFRIEAEFDASCWWPPGTGANRTQWNKIGGIGAAFNWNDHKAALAAWRPADVPNTFAVTAYTNYKDGSFTWGGNGKDELSIILVEAGQPFTVEGMVFKHKTSLQGLLKLPPSFYVDYELRAEGDNNQVDIQHRFDMPLIPLWRQRGPWFGGQEPASQNMKFKMKIKYQ